LRVALAGFLARAGFFRARFLRFGADGDGPQP